MAEVTIHSDFGAQEIKSVTASIVSSSVCCEVIGLEAMILVSPNLLLLKRQWRFIGGVFCLFVCFLRFWGCGPPVCHFPQGRIQADLAELILIFRFGDCGSFPNPFPCFLLCSLTTDALYPVYWGSETAALDWHHRLSGPEIRHFLWTFSHGWSRILSFSCPIPFGLTALRIPGTFT